MNNWLKVLLGYHQGMFHMYYYGLTPRFIVGGSQIPIGNKFDSESLAYNTTREIFEEMKDYNENGLIVVSNYCGIHNGPVMSLVESEWNENKIATTFEEIWTRYGDEIVNGTYHISKQENEILKQIFKP